MSTRAVAQVLLEQLHRALEHRQRRAQLVRGGGDERRAARPPGGAAPPACARARGARSPTSSRPLVARHRRVRALLGDPQRRGAQAAEPAQQRAGERDGERDGDEQADAGGGQQRVADLVDGRGHLGQPPLGDEHAVGPGVGRVQRHATRTSSPSTSVTVRSSRIAVQRGASSACGGGGAKLACRRGSRAALARRRTSASDEHAGVGLALAQLAARRAGSTGALEPASASLGAASQRVLELGRAREHGVVAGCPTLCSRSRSCSGPSTTRRRAPSVTRARDDAARAAGARAGRRGSRRAHGSRKR